MKKNIPRNEVIQKAKKWLASFSNDEWCEKMKEEESLLCVGIAEGSIGNSVWFRTDIIATYQIDAKVENSLLPRVDARSFRWSLSSDWEAPGASYIGESEHPVLSKEILLAEAA